MFGSKDQDDFVEELTDFISTVAYSELITVEDNVPRIRPMVYVNDGLTIYMVSTKGASKMEQIKKNPNVSVVIIKSFKTQGDTQELIINGLATFVETQEERRKVFKLFKKKPRDYQEWRLSNNTGTYGIIKIIPQSLKYFDYSTGDGIPKTLDLSV